MNIERLFSDREYLNKEDAELYTNLREDRHNANYSTKINFGKDMIEYYEEKVIDFLNKTEEILLSL